MDGIIGAIIVFGFSIVVYWVWRIVERVISWLTGV